MTFSSISLPKWRHVFILIFLIFKSALCQISYPVSVGGYSGDTVLQQFQIDSSGNLAVEGVCSDVTMVSQPNTNVLMYFLSTSINWTWAKQLQTFTNQVLIDMKFRDSDNARIAVLYESSLMIILSTVDGSIVKSAQGTSSICSMGCALRYDTSILYFFGTYRQTQDYLGIYSFDPDTQNPPSSLKGFSVPSYKLYYPIVETTNDGRFLIAALSSPSYSMFLGIPTSLSQVDFVYSNIPNTKPRSLKYIQPSSKRFFMYLQDLAAPNQFIMFRGFIDNTTPDLGTQSYYYFSSSSTTQIDFLSLEPYTGLDCYLLVYFVSTNQVVLFDSYIAYTTGTGPTAGPKYSFDAYVIYTGSSSLSLTNGAIFTSGPKYYIGGNNMQQLISLGSMSPKVAFVYSFQQIESQLTVQAQTLLMSVPRTQNNLAFLTSISASTSFSTISDAQISNTLTVLDLSFSSLPQSGSLPSCKQLKSVAGYPLTQNYYIFDTITLTIVPILLGQCSTYSCTSILTLTIVAPDIINSYDQGTSLLTVSSSNIARDGQTISFDMMEYLPDNLFSGCPYYHQALQLNIFNPLILSSVISRIIYNVGQGILNTPPFTAFNNNKGIVSDPKLNIIYQLQYSDGTQYLGGPIIGFDPSTRVISVSTTDFSLPRFNNLQIVANFAYNPYYQVTQPFSLIIEKCYNTTITTLPITTLVYQVNQPSVSQLAGPWINTFTSECEPFTYSATFTPTPAITFNPTTPSFDIFSTNPSADGLYPTVLTGYLYDNFLNQIYKSASVNFDIKIFDPSVTFLIPTIVDSQTYYIKDPQINYVIPSFTSNKWYLPPVYSLTNIDGSALDKTIFIFNQNTLVLSIFSQDHSKIGVYQLTFTAKFSKNTPYQVQRTFQVTVLHECLKNVIRASQISQQEYNIGDSQLSISIQPWSLSKSSDCQPVTYTVKMSDGSSLPNFIKFDSLGLNFKVQSPQPQDARYYQITLTGTTKYYDITKSVTQTSFALNVKCIVKSILSSQKSLSFTFQIGSVLPLTIKYKEFLVFPRCPGPQNTLNYTAKLDNGKNLPTYISFDSSQHTFTVTDNGSLQQGLQVIVLEGKLASKVKTSIKIKLNIEIPQQVQVSLDEIKLEPALIKVQSYSLLLWSIDDFKEHTSIPCTMINLDKSATFIKLLAEKSQLQLSPRQEDLGMNSIILISQTDQTDPNTGLAKKITQTVNILVIPPGYSSFLKIEAIITEISKGGLVKIDFNQKMKVPANLTSTITEQDMQVQITNKEGLIDTSINFTWSIVQFYSKQPPGSTPAKGYKGSRLVLQLKFSDPLIVSLNVRKYMNKIQYTHRTITT